MNKCKFCGGQLKPLGNGTYKCVYCNEIFSENDFISKKSNITPMANEGVDIFESNKNGTVEITCKFQTAISSGSGLLIDRFGRIITNTHVVTNNSLVCNDITVKIAGENIKASVVMLGDDNGGHGSGVDLALLQLQRLPRIVEPLSLGNFNDVKTGEQVYVIGNSLGYGTCMTSGIVSDKCRNVNGTQLLMTDCAINGGNSGGPMFNSNGAVIGVIVSGITSAEGMNFAIPIDVVKKFIEGRYVGVNQTSGAFEGDPFPKPSKKCPECGQFAVIVNRKANTEHCTNCTYYKRFPVFKGRTKALAPCPSCNSNNTWVENRIFFCDDCGFVEGDKP